MTRGLWDRETVAALLIAVVLPVAIAWGMAGGWAAVMRLSGVVLLVAGWNLVWMLARAQPPSLAGLVTALGVAVLAPVDLSPLPFVLGVSFGIVFGELVFGGWGRNPLHPGTIALAFLGFGFPAAPWPEIPVQLGWAAAASAVFGVVAGVFSARLVLGAVLVLVAGMAAGVLPAAAWPATLVVLVLLVADPVASAATQPARWMNGALYAGLALMFLATWGDAAPARVAVSAAFLAALSAPLLDEIALLAWRARRRKRLD